MLSVHWKRGELRKFKGNIVRMWSKGFDIHKYIQTLSEKFLSSIELRFIIQNSFVVKGLRHLLN